MNDIMDKIECGWSLQEAIDRCQDQAIRRQYDEAAADPDQPTGGMVKPRRRPTRSFVTGDVYHPAPRPELNKNLLPRLQTQLRDGFRKSLVDGGLIAFARKGSVTANYTKIPASAWQKLKFTNFQTSTAHESCSGQPNIRYHQVRVFPLLRSPDATELIVSISDPGRVFQKLVLRDVEFTAVLNGVRETGSTRHTNLSMGYFGPYEGQCWPVGTSEAGSSWFRRDESEEADSPVGFLLSDKEKSSPQPEAILFDRINCLMSLLRDGTIEGFGQNARSGQLDPIPRTWWNNKDNWFCFEHNRLCKKDDSQGFVPLFDGIYFKSADNQPALSADVATIPPIRAKPERNTGGRPPEYDWEAMVRHLMKIAHEGNLPESQTGRIAEVERFFADNFSNVPSEPSIKRQLKRYCHLDNKDNTID